jgi:adenylate cyclase
MTTPRSEQQLLIVFADITRFQVNARGLTDLALADLIDAYYHRVETLVLHASGQVLKFMGDGFLAVWPHDQAAAGVAALTPLKREIDAWWATHGWDSRLIVKAHFGRAVIGGFGQEGHVDVLGNAVNATAVLPGRSITLSPDAFALLDPAAQEAWQPDTTAPVFIPRPPPELT